MLEKTRLACNRGIAGMLLCSVLLLLLLLLLLCIMGLDRFLPNTAFVNWDEDRSGETLFVPC